jgi:hypothetical protein
MTSLLFRISFSAILSVTSLLVVLYRVSPLTSPGMALPFFFLTTFLSIASVGALVFYAIWYWLPTEGLDSGKKLTIALREGIFLAIATILAILCFLLNIATWWIVLLLYIVFALVEAALHV